MVKKFTIPFASQGDANDIPDALQVDGKVSFTQGFGYDYERPYDDPQAKDIAREDMNGLFKVITSAVGELQTLGASEWSSAVSYPKGAIVYFQKDLYISQVDDNQNTPPKSWVSITSIANDSLKKVANLSDLTNKATARNNLGLGSSATLNKTDVLGTSSSLVATQKLVNDTKINLDNSVRAVDIKADKKRDKNDFDFEKAGEYGGINIISRGAEIPVMYVTNQNGKMHFVGRDFNQNNIFNIGMPAKSGTVALTSDVDNKRDQNDNVFNGSIVLNRSDVWQGLRFEGVSATNKNQVDIIFLQQRGVDGNFQVSQRNSITREQLYATQFPKKEGVLTVESDTAALGNTEWTSWERSDGGSSVGAGYGGASAYALSAVPEGAVICGMERRLDGRYQEARVQYRRIIRTGR